MDLYADVLELIAKALLNALWASLAAVAVGAIVVAALGFDWLALVAAVASLAPLVAVVVTLRSHASTVREQARRAAYTAKIDV